MSNNWNQTRFASIGYLSLALLVFGGGGWAVSSNIRGAVVASGIVEVGSKRQVVEHANGGVVGELFVEDGDVVAAGQLLLRLDGSFDRSDLSVIESQLFSLLGIKARVEAEQSESPTIQFDHELLERAKTSPEVEQIVKSQAQLLMARRENRDKQVSQLLERKTQTMRQIEELEARHQSRVKQLALIEVEVSDKERLLAMGLTQKSQLSALKRDMAEIIGNISEIQASISQSKATIAETEFAVLGVSSQMREQSITSMPETEAKIAELREKRNAKLETLSRMDVRAPVAGTVFDMQIHSLRSVVRPAEPILYLVPQRADLMITTQVAPKQIDQVFVGQKVAIRLTNFDVRKTPQILGTVAMVSADVSRDEKTGAPFYTAKVVPNAGELDRLGDNKVIPGMQVETYIQTADRTPLQYLVKPLEDYFQKAFRER